MSIQSAFTPASPSKPLLAVRSPALPTGCSAPLSAQSVKKAHSVVRAALGAAVRWQLITTNPASIARTPRADPHQHKVPDLETVKSIIAVADPRMATVIRLAIATGARRGELGALKWSDIDVEQRLITFQRSVVDGGPVSQVKPTKTRTTGLVSVGEATMAAVEAWQTHQTDEAERVGVGPLEVDGWVFPSRDWGHPISLNQITYDWRTLADVHGLEGVRFHDYADLSVMPTLAGDRWLGAKSAVLMSA